MFKKLHKNKDAVIQKSHKEISVLDFKKDDYLQKTESFLCNANKSINLKISWF